MPNKLSRFWRELKRRNVHRLMAIYAGTSYVIFEASTLIFPRWGLPDWTIDLVLYLLILGAIITFVVSWIYDITPEGVQKTKPVSELKEGEVHTTPNSWKIASYISFVVIVGLIVLNIIPRTGKKEIPDKSIAVLPFTSLSNDPEKQYLADGVMEDILLNLARIEDLRVIPSISVQQYRNIEKTVYEISQELSVSYLLQGTFQKYGDQAKLIVQLIQPGLDNQVWAKDYNRNWIDIFSVQSEVAQSIAEELKAVITPEEKQVIERIPTSIMAAYDAYQRAESEMRKIPIFNIVFNHERVLEALSNSMLNYKIALENDPDYARAYAGLAEVHFANYMISGYLSEAELDSVLYYSDRAIHFDKNLASAYVMIGKYYLFKGDEGRALNEFEKAVELNPNDFRAYQNLGELFMYFDHAKSIYNYHKAVALLFGEGRAQIMQQLCTQYVYSGFLKQADEYARRALGLDGDSAVYYFTKASIEMSRGNYEKYVEWLEMSYANNPGDTSLLGQIAISFSLLRRYEEALKYADKYTSREDLLSWSDYTGRHRMAVIYWHNGFKEIADQLINEQIEYSKYLIEQKRLGARIGNAYFDLALCYAFLNKKDEAYSNLHIFLNKAPEFWLGFIRFFEDDPLLDNIRDDPEFQQITDDYKARWEERHEEIRLFLEENDML